MRRIIDESGTDVEAYTKLRELVEETGDDIGTFDIDTWMARATSRARRIVDVIPRDFVPSSILDLGSSDGSITSTLGQIYDIPRDRMFAMDVRRDPNLGIVGDSFTFQLINPGESLPFDDGQLSLVTTNMVLHHITDSLETIKEIYRILEPGGYYVITEHDWVDDERFTWFLDAVHGLYSTVLSNPTEMTPREFVDDHFAEYRSMSEWRRMIESVGFQLVSSVPPRPDNLMRSHSMSFIKPT